MKNEKKTELNSEKKSSSFFIGYIDIFFEFIYNAIFTGIFGKIFTSYSKLEEKFREGFLGRTLFNNKLHRLGSNLRKKLSRGFSGSLIIKLLGKTLKMLASFPVRSYGGMTFFFGLYIVITHFIRLLLNYGNSTDSTSLFFGIITCIVSLPLLISKESLSVAVYKGKITNFIFYRFFGLKEEAFEPINYTFKHHSNILNFLGMLLGVLTLWIQPWVIVAAIGAIVVISLIIISPEIGIISALFLFPFLSLLNYPTFFLSILIIFTLISYILKVIRGKRILKFKLVDFFVSLFAILIFTSGLVSVGGSNSFYRMFASFTLIMGYFLVVNLMRSMMWLKRCIITLSCAGAIVSTIGVVQYLFGQLETNTFDKTYFADITGRVFSLFENSNVLGSYIAMIFPLVMVTFILAQTRRTKIFSLLSIILMLTCVVLTWSRGAWLAIILSALVFLLFYSRKIGRLLVLGGLCLPFATLVIPQNILTRFLSIGDISDTSTMYRINIWKGSFRAIAENIWGGAGYGYDAFKMIYPGYAYAGIESAPHTHSLFLQILFSMGLAGLLVFAIIVILSFQQNLEFINTSNDSQGKLLVSAIFASVLAALVLGAFDYLWYNYRIFFLFWSIVALSSAFYRTKDEETTRKSFTYESDSNSANVDITIQN